MILVNDKRYLVDFIRLNEAWITRYFKLEAPDLALAKNPAQIIENGGYVFSCLVDARVVGVCALFHDDGGTFQLARMAVAEEYQGKGYGDVLMLATLEKLREIGADRVFLLTNKILIPAISLYKKHGFAIVSEGQHPVYARSDVVMERML